MLADERPTYYAVTKETARALGLDKKEQIPPDEVPDMVIEVLHYTLDFTDKMAIDPLSAILSLSENETDDPRMESAIEEILEGYGFR
jgi:hypothetical protein